MIGDPEPFEREVSNATDCCDDPDIRLSDWRWDPNREGWNFDAICHNCWGLSYGTIHAVDVEIRSDS
jgi:hypothetical protein